MIRMILAAAAVFAFCTPVWAQEDGFLALPEPGQMGSTITAEAAWDWLPGDLVFRNGLNDFDEIVKENESGQWASVGVIRPSGGGPVVVYVDEKQGVTETPLDLFIADEAYAVFRVTSLETVRAESYDLGPMALFAGILAMHMPYDTEMMLETASSIMPSFHSQQHLTLASCLSRQSRSERSRQPRIRLGKPYWRTG